MTITRREAFLTTLVGDLSTMVVDHVSPHLTLALRVLCHLTRGSYIAAKTTSTFLPLEKLTTATYTQPNDQVDLILLLVVSLQLQLVESGECRVPVLQPGKNPPLVSPTQRGEDEVRGQKNSRRFLRRSHLRDASPHIESSDGIPERPQCQPLLRSSAACS